VPTAEENMAAQLAKAAEWRAKGREDRAATADAAADRYRRIAESKTKIETASKNIAAIKEKITTLSPPTPTIPPTVTLPFKPDGSIPPKTTLPYVPNIPKPTTTPTPTYEPPIKLSSSLITETKVSPTPASPRILPDPIPPRPPAKTAPIDTVLFNDESISPEIMIDLVFEDIGGHELLSISRNDIINGQRVSYSPIKNLGLIQQTYNPNNLFSLQKTSDKYFANFAIKFDEKVPQEGSGENGVNVYIEEETGDLIIETVNMNNDEQVESEIAINGTIYEVNFGETVS